MQTVSQFYDTLYTVATPDQARACVTPPADEAAHADLLRVCESCSSAEIAAVLARLNDNTLDGYYVEHCLAGVVAVERGLHPLFDRHLLPEMRGDYHDWEWKHIYPDGPVEPQLLLGEWLTEALERAWARERRP